MGYQREFCLGYHQTSWDNGQSILRAGFENKDRTQGRGAMLGSGVYFALAPEDTCGKAMHGQPNAMMLECYVHVGSMYVANDTGDFKNATDADSVYWRGFNGRPEFVVKDNRNIYIVAAYACDPQTGKQLGPINDASREACLRYATTVWQRERLAAEDQFERQLDKMELALGIAVGSAVQISTFVIPLCIIIAWAVDVPLSLDFHPFETCTLLASVLLVAFAIGTGESNWLLGVILVTGYIIVAFGYFVHVDT